MKYHLSFLLSTLLLCSNLFGQTILNGFTSPSYTNATDNYNYTYWDITHKIAANPRKFTNHTSSYNLNIDYNNLNISSLDINNTNTNAANAFLEANSTTFPTSQSGNIDYKILQNGSVLHQKTATPTNSHIRIGQMVEYGTWLNRRVVDSLNFTNSPAIYGSFSGIEFTTWHNRFKITFHLRPRVTITNGQLELSVQIPAAFSQTYNSGSIYGFAKSPNGAGFAIKGGATAANVSVVGNTMTIQTAATNLNANTSYELSLIFYAIQSDFSINYAAAGDDVATVSVSQSLPTIASVTATYSPDEGLYFINVPGIWMGYNNCSAVDLLQNLKLTLNNTTNTNKRIRLCFRQIPGPNIVGFSSMLRNPNGDPSGMPLQISKNWHSTYNMLYSGTWIREYTEVIVPANTILNVDYTRVGARWGKVHGAFSHQLSVVGAGVSRGGWLEAGLGSFGENITHSPDYEYGNSNICDYRPFLVTNGNYGGTSSQCFWTGNVGGMDIGFYNDNSNTRIYQSQVKTRFPKYGPNLTETSISTYSTDNKLKLDYTFYLNRSDDFVRVYYKIKIKALQAAAFSRFDIFQLGSDSYNFRKARAVAYGNDAGVLGQFTPSNAGTNTYTTPATALTGTNPWIWSGDGTFINTQGGLEIETSNGIIIRSYTAFLGGQPANTPYFRERSSSNPNAMKPSQYCLVPPPSVTSFAQGDSIELLLEAVCLPKQVSDYYGTNANFIQALTQYGNTWELLQREVVGNTINATSPTHTISAQYPLTVTTSNNTGLVIITGGKNYIPLVFKGLTNITDPKLWKARNNCWELVNQANYGKDFWQTEYDAQTGTFELIYNVNQDITNDSVAIITYYLGDTTPTASLVLESKVNQAVLAVNANITAYQGDSVVFAPQITEHGTTTVGSAGKWAWTGPNNFTDTTRSITFPSAQTSHSGNYTVTYTDIFGCSVSAVFQLSISIPLPITFIDFSGKVLPTSNLLEWETSSELNNKGFDVQRQNLMKDWVALGFVPSKGNAAVYHFEDETPFYVSAYRLRQIDFDNTACFSNVIHLIREQIYALTIAPNPTSGRVKITLPPSNEPTHICIYDFSGKIVLSHITTQEILEMDLSNLSKGVYMIQIQVDKGRYQEKILLE